MPTCLGGGGSRPTFGNAEAMAVALRNPLPLGPCRPDLGPLQLQRAQPSPGAARGGGGAAGAIPAPPQAPALLGGEARAVVVPNNCGQRLKAAAVAKRARAPYPPPPPAASEGSAEAAARNDAAAAAKNGLLNRIIAAICNAASRAVFSEWTWALIGGSALWVSCWYDMLFLIVLLSLPRMHRRPCTLTKLYIAAYIHYSECAGFRWFLVWQ